jgi:dTDP-4-dehydrorhamnose reductase
MVKQKILVTGANGQLGMELRELSSAYPLFDFIFLSRHQLAIENTEAVISIFAKHRPQYCINCAAYTAVDKAESEKNEAFLINAEAAGKLAAVCRENNTRLIHISTDYVFNGEATIPYKEDAPVNPVSVYGASKLEGEKQVMKNNAASIIVRTSWVYSLYGKNFVKTMLRLLHEKEVINVVNDQHGSPTHAADLAEVLMQIISSQNWHPGIYHYTNDGIISWYDFATLIKETTGSSCNINPVPSSTYPTVAKRPPYSALDKIKIRETFGVVPKDWRRSLETCILKIKNTPK